MDMMNVVLFGKTGAGKSTVANALVTGGIEEELFEYSDDLRGCTTVVQKERRNGWSVTDTVGIGEAEDGAVSRTVATETMTAYLKEVRDSYSHIIFVMKADRVTEYDELFWKVFSEIFKGGENAFVVLFTGQGQKWLDDNKAKFPRYFKHVTTLAVNIPPKRSDPAMEVQLKQVRDKSILNLKEELSQKFSSRGSQLETPRICQLKEAELEEAAGSIIEFIVNAIKTMFDPSMWMTVAYKLSSLVSLGDLFSSRD